MRPVLRLGGFLYFMFSLLGAAWLDWHHVSFYPTEFWQIPAMGIAAIVWFIGAACANEIG